MDFRIITPVIYWLLIIVWVIVFVFYVRKLSSQKRTDKFLRLLLIILAIDAFRTLFESLYFGAWFTSISEILPLYIYDFLAQPQIVFFPKIINLIASLLVLFLIILKWLPEESNRIETLNKLLSSKTKEIEASNISLKTQVQIARESEEKYRQATINSPFPIMLHAEGGEVIFINRTWTEITGYELDDIPTIAKWTEKAYGEKSTSLKIYIDKLYEIGTSVDEGEFTITTKNGEKRIWDFNSAPLETMPDGRRMVISSAVDITEKKKTNTELKESEEWFRTIIEQAGDAMYLSDFDGNILMVNNFACQSLGYSKEQFLQMNVSDLDPDYIDDKRRKELWYSLKSGEIQTIESSHKRKNGSIFPVEIRFGQFNFKGNKSILGFVRDITKYKESELKIQKLNKDLESRVVERTSEIESKNTELANIKIALLNIVEDLNEESVLLEESTQNLENSNKELEAFSYSVSHDLKAPLRAITGFSQILNEDYGAEFSQEAKRYLGIINDNAENMGVLINDLLSFSRLGRKAIQISQVNMIDIISRVENELKSEIKNRKITFKIQPMPLVNADESLMYHVMVNLISNAIKFTSKVEKAKVEIGCKSKNNENVYYVKDNGIGFDMKFADKIFDVFQRLHSGDEFQGTGIGLSIVQRIINKHNGKIWVQSEKNKGTTFFFTI